MLVQSSTGNFKLQKEMLLPISGKKAAAHEAASGKAADPPGDTARHAQIKPRRGILH